MNEATSYITTHLIKQLWEIFKDAQLTINTNTQGIWPQIRNNLAISHTVKTNSDKIHPSIWNCIEKESKHTFIYNFSAGSGSSDGGNHKFLKRNVSFIVAFPSFRSASRTNTTEEQILTANTVVRQCLTWLLIIQKISKNNVCNRKDLEIYLLLSPIRKMLPSSSSASLVLNWEHSNSAFTFLCGRGIAVSQEPRRIIIFRREEWFKVFIHETIHNYGLDFSGFSEHKLTTTHEWIKTHLFPVQSEINLYEAYTEFWARFLCTVFRCNGDVQCVEEKLSEEIAFSNLQIAKILNHMGFSNYSELTNKKSSHKYQEKTSILSYYIITGILLQNYKQFISHCHHQSHPHINSIVFLRNCISFPNDGIQSFCQFLQNNYKNKSMIKNINRWIKELNTHDSSINRQKLMRNTLRMTFGC